VTQENLLLVGESGIINAMQYGMPPEERDKRNRKFIGVEFECCHVYSRIYFNETAKAYQGYCPLCHRRVKVRVDAEKGIDARFFRLKIR
jgi:hypothetical protein